MCVLLAMLNPRTYARENLSFEAKKRWTISLVFVSNFLGGTEFAIILPTVWQYLQRMGIHDETYMGYVTSAFSFSGMFSGLFLGRLADATENIRLIALLVNLFQIVGQMLYFVGNSAYVLIFGRFLNGIGVGMNSALYADVIRGTQPSERSRVLTGIFMTRQISIMLAPAYNVILRHIPTFSYDVTLFGIPVKIQLDELSASGFVVCALWIIFEIFVFIFYFNIAEEMKFKRRADRLKKRQDVRAAKFLRRTSGVDERSLLLTSEMTKLESNDEDDNEVSDAAAVQHVHQNGTNGEAKFAYIPEKERPAEAVQEEEPNSAADDVTPEHADFTRSQRIVVQPARRGTYGSSLLSDESAMTGETENRSAERQKHLSQSEDNSRADYRLYMKEFFRPEIVALLFMQMTSLFVQTMIETIVPPLLQEYFGYGTVENSYFFMAVGIQFVLIYVILLVVLGKKEHARFSVSERAALLFSSGCLVTSLIGFIIVGQFLESGRPELLYAFAAVNMVLFIAVPTTSVSSVALIAHVLDARAQGLGQGIRRFCTFVGIIFGPLWGGSMIFRPLGLYGGAMILALVAFVLVLGSYRQFDVMQGGPPKEKKDNSVKA